MSDYNMTEDEFRNYCMNNVKFEPEEEKAELINEFVNYRLKFIKTVEDNEIQSILMKYGFSLPKNCYYCNGIFDPVSQYRGVAYWYAYELDISDKNMNPGYENLWGIHIMPYCITKEDVINAVPMIKAAKGDNMFRKKPGHVDYDHDSANIHKWPVLENPQYQVVLIPRKGKYGKAGGPGFKEEKFANVDGELVKNITVKQNMYFPRIDSIENYKPRDLQLKLKESLKNAFSTVFENKYFDENWDKKWDE